MAVETINYANKSYINQNSGVADTNKVNDTDMNEIKSVVNNNALELQSCIDGTIYSTNETDTGNTWIDGKPIYRKVIQTTNAQCQTDGNLVDKNVSISSLNIDTMVDLKFSAQIGNNYKGFSFMFGGNDTSKGTRCYYDINGDNIVIRNSTTSYNSASITLILEYTKAS